MLQAKIISTYCGDYDPCRSKTYDKNGTKERGLSVNCTVFTLFMQWSNIA